MDDLTLVCRAITLKAGEGVVFEASDLVLPKEVSSQVLGQAFRICGKNRVIVKVRSGPSNGAGRNGSLVWFWRGA